MSTKLHCLMLLVAVLIASLAVGADELAETPITDSDREHWSFRPLSKLAVPTNSDAWIRTPIDAFILTTLQAKQLRPHPDADRATLIRRLHFDLVGLPPTSDRVDAFVADQSPTAYERLVDEVLASPRLGERWAQFWLDLASFAETDGFEHDLVRKDAWRYRDWVIGALNADMPYDQFLRRQLAADEETSNDPSAAIATMFCLAGPDMPDVNSQEERRHQLLNQTTANVGSVLLGLQFGCAQCHDHKYDPLSIGDFYRLRAVFEPAIRLKKNESASVLRDHGEAIASFVMLRGNWQQRGPQVQPGLPRIVNAELRQLPGSKQRLALADWVTRPDHPLTARVIANRIWQQHFGAGLSHTTSDFGVMGDAPTHPELLDWLARELIDSGWSLKHLHRLIASSSVYRQASRPIGAEQVAQTADTSNLYLSRFPRQRLSGESLRDAMLVATGSINLSAGGPSVFPPLPDEVVRRLLKKQWTASERAADHYRRSIFVFARRNLRYPIFEAFDRPDANASCPQRPRSTTAPQSLLLLNSELSLELAQRFAGRVLREAGETTAERIRFALNTALGREPSAAEAILFADFYRAQVELIRREDRSPKSLSRPIPVSDRVGAAESAALVDVCLAVFNMAEFLYVD